MFLIVYTGEDFDAAVEQIERLSDRHPGARIAIDGRGIDLKNWRGSPSVSSHRSIGRPVSVERRCLSRWCWKQSHWPCSENANRSGRATDCV